MEWINLLSGDTAKLLILPLTTVINVLAGILFFLVKKSIKREFKGISDKLEALNKTMVLTQMKVTAMDIGLAKTHPQSAQYEEARDKEMNRLLKESDFVKQ